MTPRSMISGRVRGSKLPVWRVIDLGRCEPVRAVAFAEAVAPSVARGQVPNTLLFSQTNRSCASVGFHQSVEEEIDPDFARRRRLSVLRRVEGGGTVYLDPDQLFYQFVYADTAAHPGGPADFPAFLAAPAEALRSMRIPAELRLPSDIVVGGRKVSGNAGGDWEGAHLITGDILGRADGRAMADLLRLPHRGLRALLRREVARWMTSSEAEAGVRPDWARLKEGIVGALPKLGVGTGVPGMVTEREEKRFRAEVVPRHRSPAWLRPAVPVPSPNSPVRRIRVAGPHGILVFRSPDRSGMTVAVVKGRRLRKAYRLGTDPDALLRAFRPGSAGWRELARRVLEVGGLE